MKIKQIGIVDSKGFCTKQCAYTKKYIASVQCDKCNYFINLTGNHGILCNIPFKIIVSKLFNFKTIKQIFKHKLNVLRSLNNVKI